MDPLTMGLIGGLLGLGKGAGGNAQTERDWKLKAETDRYSPWTHKEGEKPKDRSMLGDILTGSLMGYLGGKSLGMGGGLSTSGSGGLVGGLTSDGMVTGGSPWSGVASGFQGAGAAGGFNPAMLARV